MNPVPRTAILAPWFQASFGKNVFANRPIRMFPQGWNEDTAAFGPAAVAGTFEQLYALARAGGYSLTHAVIVLWRLEQNRLTEADRDLLWSVFRVPVFEQIIGNAGMLIAAECEAHDGLHVETSSVQLDGESLDHTPCPCGKKTSRIGVTHSGVLQQTMAAYAK